MGTTVLEGGSFTLDTLLYLFRGYCCGLSVEFDSFTRTRGRTSSSFKCLLCFSNDHVYVGWAKLWLELNRGLRVWCLNALWKGKPLIYDVFVAITTEKVSESPDLSSLVCSTYEHGLILSVLVSASKVGRVDKSMLSDVKKWVFFVKLMLNYNYYRHFWLWIFTTTTLDVSILLQSFFMLHWDLFLMTVYDFKVILAHLKTSYWIKYLTNFKSNSIKGNVKMWHGLI